MNLSGNADSSNIVTPANAGVQCSKRYFKCDFTNWIPAFAGMTAKDESREFDGLNLI